MAADAAQTTADQPFTWLRCVNCGAGLWKRFADHLEMSVSPRGRQVRTIRVPLEAASAVRTTCEKCGQTTELAA